ncbi:Rap1 GTPase-activating protein 1 [Anthophora quadrimaculata]
MSLQNSRLRHYRTMTAICFVCNLPILSHQVGLIWQGGNGWDDLMREQVEESTWKQRLGTGRRTSATQITSTSPPNEPQEPSATNQPRRRSSLSLTDVRNKLCRRETITDFAKSLAWSRQTWSRRESSVDSGIKSQASTKSTGTTISNLKNDISRLWGRKDATLQPQPSPTVISPSERVSSDSKSSRRGSGESGRTKSPGERQHSCSHHRRRQSQQSADSASGVMLAKYYSSDQRPSASSTDSAASNAVREHLEARNSMDRSDRSSSIEAKTQPTVDKVLIPTTTTTTAVVEEKVPVTTSAELKTSTTTTVSWTTTTVTTSSTLTIDTKIASDMKNLTPDASITPPTIVMSSVTPPSVSPTTSRMLALPGTSTSGSSSPVGSPNVNTPTHPMLTTRRDSTTQCYQKEKEASPNKLSRLKRQSATVDESTPPTRRRGSQPTLSPNPEERGRARRDSLSPDSASYPRRRDSRSHLSPDRAADKRDISPIRERSQLARQSISMSGRSPPRSPDGSSCSSRDPSPCACAADGMPAPIITQSTTKEILLSRGFRRQSTTEEIMRSRNFRRQSSQSEEAVQRYRGRRDSSVQITDGTLATMTVEISNTFFDSSTQTEPLPLYDNNHYHEECLKCNSCGLNLTGPNQKRARRFKNQILCDLHFADVALMECSDFMQQLRSFKPQCLGCAVARRKSSTTLIFPLPPQACSDEFCNEFPHNMEPTPGYWIECSRQQITSDTIWDESESEEATDTELAEVQHESDTDELPRKKTTIEEQWEKNQGFELTSVEQETYEKYFYGTEHWNYFTNDEELGPVILSIKQETLNNRDQFRILVRAISYTVHGLIPASCVFADRYDREEVVRSLGKEVNVNPPLTLGQLPDTQDELLKLDQVFIKSELKVGVLYVQENQCTEEEILDNHKNSPLFDEFLQILGDKIRLRNFDKYKGGLDTIHDLTGLYSVYTNWRGIEIMYHVSTFLPNETHDEQRVQKKRHIGNDIVCVVFLEADKTPFNPACMKSHFLYTFILVRVSPRIKRKVTRYEVSVATRDEVGAYKPYLWEQNVFKKGPMFREWLLTKIVNGERASYSAPKFAKMQERTRTQMLEDIVANLDNHALTGQIPKPYRRGSWRPIGHMRPSSPLLDSLTDLFENYDKLGIDFTKAFLNNQDNVTLNASLFDVSFLVQGPQKQKVRLYGVRAILAVRSRVFQEMLYGIQAGFGSPQVPVAELLAKPAPALPGSQKPRSSNFLQVPDVEAPRPKSEPPSPMVKRAFSRITAGWGRSIRKQVGGNQLQGEDRKRWTSSQDCSNKEAKEKEKAAQQLAVPRLSVCADAQKVDRAKLAQTEFEIIEFDPKTFRILLDYLQTGSCPLTCSNIPGLICAAEHYDLPELLQACFHHAKQFLRIDIVCVMLCALENYCWRYTSASELVNMILAFIETRAYQLFQNPDFLTLSESMVQMIMCRGLDVYEIRKFEAMLEWAKNRVKDRKSTKLDPKVEFKCIMERLSRDLKLHKITPQELIRIVLPSKAIRNERILDTLMYQANSGIYRNVDSYLEAYQKKVQNQESFDCGM